jgi:hypothetical protein
LCKIREHPAEFPDWRPHGTYDIDSVWQELWDVSTALSGAKFTSKSESAGAPQFVNFDLLPTVFFPEQTAICAHNLHGNASQAACAGPPDSL